MIALIESYKAGLLSINNFRKNIIAGVIVGIVALPLAMAFAIASGLKPEQGIYTAIISGLIVGIFGGTRSQISGATGAFVVILAGIVANYGFIGLQVTTLLAGFILCGMGVLRLGNAVKFIPYPVIVGFTSGIAMIIFVGQWKDFFGLPISIPNNVSFFEKCKIIILSLPTLDFATTILSSVSLAILIFGPKFIKIIPSPLLAMIFGTLIQSYFMFPSISTIGSVFGDIPQTLPSFNLPNFSKINLSELIGPAFTVALLGAIESLLSAAAADSISGTKHNSNQELIGQGLANIATPLFGGFASTGAIARTITCIRYGGNCIIASITHSVVLILVLLVLAPYAKNIPLAVLSAILFVVAFNMSDIPGFLHIVKNAPWYDIIVLVATFFLTIFTDLVIAVMIGVIIAMLFFIVRTCQTVSINHQKCNQTDIEKLELRFGSKFTSDGIICTIQGPFFFGVTEKIEHALATTYTDPKFVVFKMLNIPFIDMTGLETLKKIIEQYRKRNIKVYVCEANKTVSHKLLKVGILDLVENSIIFDSIEQVAEHYLKAQC